MKDYKMKLTSIILYEGIEYDPAFNKLVDAIKDAGGIYKGSGDYGSVYFLKGKAVKVTTDGDELDHAELIKGKKTNNFVHIFDVKRHDERLGVITMEILSELDNPEAQITEEFIAALEQEANRLGIPADELDLTHDGNFMKHPKSGKLKHIDV